MRTVTALVLGMLGVLYGSSAWADDWVDCQGTSSNDTITIGRLTSTDIKTYCCITHGTTNTLVEADASPISLNPTVYGLGGNDHITVVRSNFPVSVGCNGGVTFYGVDYGTHFITLVGDAATAGALASPGHDVIDGGDGEDKIWGDDNGCSDESTNTYGSYDTINTWYGSSNIAHGCGGDDIAIQDEGTNGQVYGGEGGDCLGVQVSNPAVFICGDDGNTSDNWANSSPWVVPTSAGTGGTSTCGGMAVASCT